MGLTEEVVEKDYVLGWLLWGIGTHPAPRDTWVFKGGTSLKKCFVETYRFSEDLDFTVLDGGPLAPDDLMPVLDEMLESVESESGLELRGRTPPAAHAPRRQVGRGAHLLPRPPGRARRDARKARPHLR